MYIHVHACVLTIPPSVLKLTALNLSPTIEKLPTPMLQYPYLESDLCKLDNIRSWTTAILHLFSQETNLLKKVIMKCVYIQLWDILGCFHYILNAPRIHSHVPSNHAVFRTSSVISDQTSMYMCSIISVFCSRHSSVQHLKFEIYTILAQYSYNVS